MLVNTIERDTRYDRWKAGVAEGKSLGLVEGDARSSHQKALETARNLLTMGYPLGDICKIVGLSQEEVAAIN